MYLLIQFYTGLRLKVLKSIYVCVLSCNAPVSSFSSHEFILISQGPGAAATAWVVKLQSNKGLTLEYKLDSPELESIHICDTPELWRCAAGLCARVRACAGAADSVHTCIYIYIYMYVCVGMYCNTRLLFQLIFLCRRFEARPRLC